MPDLSTKQRNRIRNLVAALRSGKFKQGKSALNRLTHPDHDETKKRVRKFCCLGVACEVSIKDGLKLERGIDLDRQYETNPGENYQEVGYKKPGDTHLDGTFLPNVVTKWYGFDSDDPVLETDTGRYSASTLNDVRGGNFDQIADAFERTYLPKDYKATVKTRKSG